AEATRLAKGLVAHWLAESEKRREAYRFLGAITAVREALRVEPAPDARARLQKLIAAQTQIDSDLYEGLYLGEKNRHPEAIATLTKAWDRRPDFPVAHGKLGMLYAQPAGSLGSVRADPALIAGQRRLAVEHLEAVAKYDPDDSYGHTMLGWLAYVDGRLEEA